MLLRQLRTQRARGQRGQFVVIYIMGIFAMAILAFAAIGVGQIVVRKQWAQMIADAAAFAGASKQAEGLNTISEITDTQLTILNAIQAYDRLAPTYLMGWLDCWMSYLLVNNKYKDIQDAHKQVHQIVFTPLSLAVDGINLVYPELAWNAAKEVTEENIQNFFPNETLGNFNYPKVPYITGCNKLQVPPGLAELTPVFYDSVAWHYTATDLGPCYWGVCAGPVCTAASYATCDISGVAGLYGQPPHNSQPSPPESSYKFEKVLKVMAKNNQTSFLWWVKIPAVKPILGLQKPLGSIPDIIAIARAKPYGGHIGWGDGSNTEREEWPNRHYIPLLTWSAWWTWDHSPSQTYKAKLIPVLPMGLVRDASPVAELMIELNNSPIRELTEFAGIAH